MIIVKPSPNYAKPTNAAKKSGTNSGFSKKPLVQSGTCKLQKRTRQKTHPLSILVLTTHIAAVGQAFEELAPLLRRVQQGLRRHAQHLDDFHHLVELKRTRGWLATSSANQQGTTRNERLPGRISTIVRITEQRQKKPKGTKRLPRQHYDLNLQSFIPANRTGRNW